MSRLARDFSWHLFAFILVVAGLGALAPLAWWQTRAPGDPAALTREFAGWDPLVEAIIAQVDTTFRWGLYDREPLPTWTRSTDRMGVTSAAVPVKNASSAT